MSQAELRELFLASGVAEPSTAFRLVPVDPCRALERGNARLVRREVRIRALRAWWRARRGCGGGEQDEQKGGAGIDARAAKKRHNVGGEQDEQEGGAGIDARDAYMAALDERGPDQGAVVEGPGLVMSVDDAVGERQQNGEGGAEKEELDDDDNDEDDDEVNDDDDEDDDEDDEDDDDEVDDDDDKDDDEDDDEDDEAKTATETEAATALVMKTTTGTGTAHGDVGV